MANEIVPYRGGRFYFTAGRVRRRGVETGARVATRAGVALQAALTWNAHRYTRYLVDSVHYDTTKAGIFADFSGNRVVGVPAFTGSVSLDIAPAVVKTLRVRFGVESMSSFFADDANQVKVSSYRIAARRLRARTAAQRGGRRVARRALAPFDARRVRRLVQNRPNPVGPVAVLRLHEDRAQADDRVAVALHLTHVQQM